MTQKKSAHHHGNLRHALVQAGIALLTEGGRSNLTLRKAAAYANVSHAAPAHHFDGLDGLLQAIAGEGFKTFSTYMLDARDTADPAPRAQLMAIAQGYLDFAKDHEALFDLIFSEPIKNSKDQILRAEADKALGILSDTCALFEEHPNGPMVNEISIWASVHGYAILRKFDRIKPNDAKVEIPYDWVMPELTPKTKT